jgi:hypothetical protein
LSPPAPDDGEEVDPETERIKVELFTQFLAAQVGG